uniref:uncharacterized protein LOC113474270 n=1 Tax=Ciona intestinalis TaxID=7719 RepID=UPI000EF4FF7A|nr:uncharacterized protein LOC113474270 [Ciona intestinalis]|eukprot:XP_026690468.1 uncharacterized protein LOC113474270 [Ciona intestinalis]
MFYAGSMNGYLVVFVVTFLIVFTFAIETAYRCLDVDDDLECKRRGNEGLCGYTDKGFTCGCLFHDKPASVQSHWDAKMQIRSFSQFCEPVTLPFHEDTCKLYLGNPNEKEDWKMVCPNSGFIQSWGAFPPVSGSFHARIWYRCCNAKCPSWTCKWSPFTQSRKDFNVPVYDEYVRAVRSTHLHDKMDNIWSLELCQCVPTPPSKGEL